MMEKQKELIEAKTKNLQSAERIEELYKEAMNAMREYNGSNAPSTEQEEEPDDE